MKKLISIMFVLMSGYSLGQLASKQQNSTNKTVEHSLIWTADDEAEMDLLVHNAQQKNLHDKSVSITFKIVCTIDEYGVITKTFEIVSTTVSDK